MTKSRVILLAVAIILFLYVPLSNAALLISTYSVDNKNPQINNHGDIVWQGVDPLSGDDSEIFLRFSGGSIRQMTDNDEDDQDPQISERNSTYGYPPSFVYSRGPNIYFIYYYTIVNDYTGEAWLHNTGLSANPDICETADFITYIAWQSWINGGWDIILSDPDGNRPISANDATDDTMPKLSNSGNIYWIGGGCLKYSDDFGHTGQTIACGTDITQFEINDSHHVVWSDSGVFGNLGIFHYNPTTDSTVQITDNEYDDIEPDINNSGYMVWSGHDGNDYEIFHFNPTTGDILQLTDNTVDDRNPKINNHNAVVWEADGEIYLDESDKGPGKTWTMTYGDVNWESASSVDIRGDEYVIAGGMDSSSTGSQDVWVLRVDADGNVLRQNAYGGSSAEGAGIVKEGTVVGMTDSFGAGKADIYLVGLTYQGTIISQKTYGGPEDDGVSSMIIGRQGFYKLLAGTTQSFGAGINGDIWVLKVDAGNEIGPSYPGTWQKTYGTAAGGEGAADIIETNVSGYIVAGNTYSFGAVNGDIWVLKIDTNGNVGASYPGTWQKTYGGSEPDFAVAIRQTMDGGYIVAGNSFSFDVGISTWDVWVLKLDADGEIDWQKAYGTTADDHVSALEVSRDGRYIMAGYTGITGPPAAYDGWVMKIDVNGNIMWQKTYGSKDPQGSESLADIKPTYDGGYIALGGTGSFGIGQQDVWVLKMDQNGDIDVGECPSLSIKPWIAGAADTSVSAVDTATVTEPAGVIIMEPTTTKSDTNALKRDVCNPLPMTNLPKTGQSRSYNAGDDGYVQAGVAWPALRFSDHGNGTVTDNLTGLVWLKDADCFGKRYWVEAVNDSNSLADGQCGLSDGSSPGYWRLANINELESLIHAAAADQATWLNGQGFENVQSDLYWSSTTPASENKYNAYLLNMGDANMRGSSKSYRPYYVWPVSGGQATYPDPAYPANVWKTGQTWADPDVSGDDGDLQMGVIWANPRFADNIDGTVTDNLTGLVWLKDASCLGQVNWETTFDTIDNFNLNPSPYGCLEYDPAKHLDQGWMWRVPNRKECGSLIDYSQSRPALQVGHWFENIPPFSLFWTSTTNASDTDLAWMLDIWFGELTHSDKSTGNFYIWPVRGGGKPCRGDLDDDGDVDGTDLSDYMEDSEGLNIDQLAGSFGKINCLYFRP